MALQDHFHPPLSKHRHWHAFHNAWATYIAADLNHRLPEGYFAEPNVQFGIEIDVAAFEEAPSYSPSQPETLQQAWQPPPPEQTIPFEPTTEAVEVNIFQTEEGPTLTGVIELVSPANKDRDAHREAFVSKCEAYLQQGLGLILADIVTGRSANLHNDLIARISSTSRVHMSAALYTVAYRVVEYQGRPSVDMWRHTLELGQALPTLPLWLHGDICLPIELNTTYELTCREQRIQSS
jgi:hypothetical protein